jgi:hypothetical protein
MKWLVTILAILVGVLLIATIKLASSTPVDSSAEALRAMAELREALQHCEAANPQRPCGRRRGSRHSRTGCLPRLQNRSVCVRLNDLGKSPRCGVLAYSGEGTSAAPDRAALASAPAGVSGLPAEHRLQA